MLCKPSVKLDRKVGPRLSASESFAIQRFAAAKGRGRIRHPSFSWVCQIIAVFSAIFSAKSIPGETFFYCYCVFPNKTPSSSSCQVLAHFDGNLVVVPIVYNFEAQQAHIKQAYGQVQKPKRSASRQHQRVCLRVLETRHSSASHETQ